MGVKNCVEIQRPVEGVFFFASNATNLPLYDKSIREVKKIADGPIDIGTKFNLIASQFGMRLDVVQTITAFEPSHHFAYRVDTGPFPIETHFTLESLANGTLLCGEREPQPGGFWKLLVPLISIPARKKFEAELNELKDYLDANHD